MTRSFTYTALTLRVKSSGESNREAWFLTEEEGLVRATVFGGPKSRFRSLVSPFHQGKLWIYHDPVRDSRKVNDFDVQFYRMGIRELWERAACADALAETILSSSAGGGNWSQALELAGAVLDALEGADAALCTRLAVYFLWHWIQLLGLGPELPSRTCEGGHDGLLLKTAGPAAIAWLKRIESLPPAAMKELSADLWSVDAPALDQAKTLSKSLMAEALGRRLPTWDGI